MTAASVANYNVKGMHDKLDSAIKSTWYSVGNINLFVRIWLATGHNHWNK